MPIVPSAFVHRERIDTGVTKASRALTPEVVRIRYTLSEDWTGSATVFTCSTTHGAAIALWRL
ncbi:MAG: hypothetical protein ABSH09_13115 [Bryobacteraceae bacterium]